MTGPAGAVAEDPYIRLVEAVLEAKGGSPLASVTVVTSSFAVSRDVLHHLARTIGVVNTTVLTTSQLVERLAGPQLAPRTPLPYPLLVGSVRRALAENPGLFAEVADQTITARAIANASQWLGAHPAPAADGCAQVVGEVLRIHHEVSGGHSATHYLRHEEFAAAEARLGEVGPAIVFLPCEQDSAAAGFLEKVRERASTVDSTDVATGSLVLHASDADDEVRTVARLVRDRLVKGVPGHRIGVFYGAESPYLGSVLTHFAAAGIEVAGPDSRGLADGSAARSLLRLLRMAPGSIQRRELLAILAQRSIRWTGGGETERLSLRQAELLTRQTVPIVGGADWEALRGIGVDHPRHATAQSLLSLVEALRASLSAVAAARDWVAAAAAVTALIEDYFVGGESGRDFAARRDYEALHALAVDLSKLDQVGPPPTVAGIIDALEVGIASVSRRVGEMGSAVTVGPIGEGSGRDLDISIILGMAEGIIPDVHREDPLLPESITGVTQADQLLLQRRALELAIGAGRRERILSFPRGSLRGGAEKVPSRWLLPTLRALAGEKVSETNWQTETAGCDQVVELASFDVGMRAPRPPLVLAPATAAEWRARMADPATGALVAGDPLMTAIIANARHLRGDRRQGRFTRFTGNLAAVADLIRILDEPIAPTRLEEWVASPYLFFIQRILGVSPLDDPDEDMQIDPLRRGDLVHKILEDYVAEVIEGADGGQDRLLSIGDAHLQEATDTAPGWLPQVWERDARIIRADLETWHALDVIERAQGWTPIGAETSFGGDGETPVHVDLEHGGMRFLGKIDRIDRHTDGRVRVTDYKTGGSKYSEDLVEANPTANTTKFQLPVYGLLGRTLAGESAVTARYWFATTRGDFKPIGYPITDHVIDMLRRDLTFCQLSIRAGMFPPRLGSLSVRGLGQLLGATELERTWQALRHEPALRDLVAIHDGEGLPA